MANGHPDFGLSGVAEQGSAGSGVEGAEGGAAVGPDAFEADAPEKEVEKSEKELAKEANRKAFLEIQKTILTTQERLNNDWKSLVEKHGGGWKAHFNKEVAHAARLKNDFANNYSNKALSFATKSSGLSKAIGWGSMAIPGAWIGKAGKFIEGGLINKGIYSKKTGQELLKEMKETLYDKYGNRITGARIGPDPGPVKTKTRSDREREKVTGGFWGLMGFAKKNPDIFGPLSGDELWKLVMDEDAFWNYYEQGLSGG